MFELHRYFDTYHDGIVGVFETKEEAEKEHDRLYGKRAYVTYQVKQV